MRGKEKLYIILLAYEGNIYGYFTCGMFFYCYCYEKGVLDRKFYINGEILFLYFKILNIYRKEYRNY